MESCATRNFEICGPCKRGGENETTSSWCIDCAEALCTDCEKHHRHSKMSNLHKIIPLQKLKITGDFLKDFTLTCNVHSEGCITFYCTNHDKLCCPTCVTSHQKECNNVATLDHVSTDVKKSGMVEDLETRMKDALQTLVELENHKNENIAMINAQKEGIKTNLNELRQKINQYFDSLENRISEKLTQAHAEIIEKLEMQTQDLHKKIETLKAWQTDVKLIKDYGSDVHVFILLKQLEKLVTELETFNKTSTENFIGLNLTFLTSTNVESLQEKVHALGEISVNKSSTELIITPRKSGRFRSKLVDRCA